MNHDDPCITLTRQAVAGDQRALGQLLLHHYDRLIRRIERRLPRTLRRRIDAEDVLQQTFLAVFRSIGTLHPEDDAKRFYRWLCTIADHRLLDAVRAQSSRKRGGDRKHVSSVGRTPAGSLRQLIDMLAGARRTPSQSLGRHETLGALREGFGQLRADYRRALHLRYVQGMGVADAAVALERTPRSIHSLCHRGLCELRAIVGASTQYLTRTY